MPPLPLSPEPDNLAHAREVFRRVEREFLELDRGRVGSVTIHFVAGPKVRKVEWRLLDDVARA